MVMHRRTTTDTPSKIMLGSQSGNYVSVFYNASGVFDYETGAGGQTPDATFTHTQNEWAVYAITVADYSLYVYAWDDALTRTTVVNNAYFAAGAPTDVVLGDPQWDETAVGEYRYFRFWNSALSATDLDAEAASATAVITSNLTGDWYLDDSSDTADRSGIGNTLTFTGTVATSAEEPSYVGGSSFQSAWTRNSNQVIQ